MTVGNFNDYFGGLFANRYLSIETILYLNGSVFIKVLNPINFIISLIGTSLNSHKSFVSSVFH